MAGPAILLRSEGALVEVNDPNSSAGWLVVPGVSGYSEQGGEATSREVSSFEGIRAVTGRPGIGTVQITYASYLAHVPANRAILAAKAESRSLQFRVTTPEEAIASASGETAAIAIGSDGIVDQGSSDKDSEKFDFTSEDLGPGLVLALFVSTDDTVAAAVEEGKDQVTFDGTAPTPDFAEGHRIAFGTGALASPPSYTVRSVAGRVVTLVEPTSEPIAADAVAWRAGLTGGYNDTGIRILESISEVGVALINPKETVAATKFAQLIVPSLRRQFTATIQQAGSWELGDQSQVGSTMTLQPSATLADPTVLY